MAISLGAVAAAGSWRDRELQARLLPQSLLQIAGGELRSFGRFGRQDKIFVASSTRSECRPSKSLPAESG